MGKKGLFVYFVDVNVDCEKGQNKTRVKYNIRHVIEF